MLSRHISIIHTGSAVGQSRRTTALLMSTHGRLSPRPCARPTARRTLRQRLLDISSRGSISCRYYDPNQQGQPTEELEHDRYKSTSPLVAIAVDGTDASRLALAWAVDQLLCSGDAVRLVHVLCNDRAGTPSVGTSLSGRLAYQPDNSTASVDAEDNIRELGSRMHQRADDIVMEHMVPLLASAGVPYQVSYPTYTGARSAAIVGDTICRNAAEAGAKMLLIASHSSGVMAEFGSVASYCYQHSTVPLVVVPPRTLGRDADVEGWGASGPLALAVADQAELARMLGWVGANLLRPGDHIQILHTATSPSAPPLHIPDSYPAALSAHPLDTSAAALASTSDLADEAVSTLEDSLGSFAAADARNAVGIALVEAAQKLNARALVLPVDRRSHELISELAQTSVPTYALRHSSRPLVFVRH